MKKHFAFCLLPFAFCLSYAQEPASNPTHMQFTSVTPYNFVMSFTGVAAAGYLVLKSSSPVTFIPADGTTYEKGQGVVNAKVVSVTNATAITIREVLEGTKYYFAVFAFNGSGNGIDYKQTDPLVDSITSLPADAGSYYASIDSSSASFVADLHNLIYPHTQISYTPGYASTIMPVLYERDTIGGQEVVNCEYSGYTYVYTPPFSFVSLVRFSREHVLCKSWMPTGGNTSNPDASDQHNLLLTELDHANTPRSNNPLGIVVNATDTFLNCKLGTDVNFNTVFEPQDETKGMAARAMMYEMVCYNGLNGNWGLNFLPSQATEQNQDILKLWNTQYPPSKFEKTKNEYVYAVQHNRNPFIDHPEWVRCINFDSLLKTNLCGALSGIYDASLEASVRLYPNPSENMLRVEMDGNNLESVSLEVFDFYGRKLKQFAVYSLPFTVATGDLAAGNYLLRISSNGKTAWKKFSVLH